MIIKVKVKHTMADNISEVIINDTYAGMYPTEVAKEIHRRIINSNTEEEER